MGMPASTFEAIDHPAIERWVKAFVDKEQFTGQIAFDFIEVATGELYAIECNPRGTSGLHLFQEADNLPEAFFQSNHYTTPTFGYAKQLAWGMFFYGWKHRKFSKFMKKFLSLKDVIFSRKDLKPFFFNLVLLVVYFYRSFKLRENLVSMFTFDIDWNGEELTSLDQQMACEKLN